MGLFSNLFGRHVNQNGGGLMPGDNGRFDSGLMSQGIDVSQPMPQQHSGGNKTLWGILGALGDGLAVYGNAKPAFMPAMLDMQQRADEERKWNTQLQQQATLKREEMAASQRNKTWQDNAGNMWRMGENGQPEPAPYWVDRAPKMSLQADGFGGVTMVPQVNPFDIPSAPVGKLTPMGGGQPSPMAPASPANTPTRPAQTISQADFMRLQKAMGPQGAMNYIRSQNIAIGN